MTKHIVLVIFICLLPSMLRSQEWTKKDSLDLNRLMKGEGEIKLNREVLRQIDFGSGMIGAPLISTEKEWMSPDATLPSASPDVLPLDVRRLLTLHPYKPTTPYNWDPIYQKKIKVGKDTWRGDAFYHFKTQTIYTNWAKTPMDAGARNSVAEIEATGLRYNPLSGRVNNAMTGAWEGVSAPTGYDFGSVFTKDFWDKKGRTRRIRTLEVLKAYGDSTTIQVTEPVLPPIIR